MSTTTDDVGDLDFGDATEEQINAAMESGDLAVIESLLKGVLIIPEAEKPEFEEVLKAEPEKKLEYWNHW